MIGRIVWFPVGWGMFGLLEDHSEDHTDIVITDGGSNSHCYHYAMESIRNTLHKYLKNGQNYKWIISHFDYDHFSLVGELIKNNELNRPDECFVPATYSTCKDTLVRYLALEDLILSKVIRYISYPEALGQLRNCKRITPVGSGKTLDTSNFTFQFIWPDTHTSESDCSELSEKIRQKVDKYCKEHAGEYEGGYNGCLRRYQEIFEQIYSNIKEIPSEGGNEGEGQTRLRYDKVSPEHTFSDKICIAELIQYRSIIDHELADIRRNALNYFSLGYILSPKLKTDYIGIIKNNILPAFPLFTKFISGSKNFLLFLGDMEYNAINNALRDRPKKYEIVIAAHHGNSYGGFVRGKIAILSRCDLHVPRSWRNVRREYRRNFTLNITTGHSNTVEIRLF